MTRGSVLFYSGSVYHGGGANRSDTTPHRPQHHLQRGVAAPGGEPVPLGASRGGRRRCRPSLLRLMGYDRGAYALGYIDDLRDPIEAVRPGIGSTGFAARPDVASRGPGRGVARVARSVGSQRRLATGVARATGSNQVRVGAGTVGVVPVEIREARVDDYDDLYVAFSRIVGRRGGVPAGGTAHACANSTTTGSTTPRRCAVARSAAISSAAYYVKPNFVGRAPRTSPTPATSCWRPTGALGSGAPGRAFARGGTSPRLRRHAVQPGLRVQPGPGHVHAGSASPRWAASLTPSTARTRSSTGAASRTSTT